MPRDWLPLVVCLLFLAVGPLVEAEEPATADAAKRPNILWIVSEDNGPFLSAYGFQKANTPNLDRLAREGVLYRNAFANAPVCAPARNTIITGVMAPSMGTLHMRSRYRVPEMIELFPKYLRQAGYYTSNRSKTDYNLAPVPNDGWDKMTGGHWRDRQPGQPFFSVFNIGVSHESSLHGSRVEPELLKVDFELPPYHPDTPEIRSNWVEYVTRIVPRMDQEVGKILKQLEEDGLADDTIVIYYADHGGILTRSKRYLYDTGVHVPMIVRVPPKFAHLAPGKPGAETDRLVSFVDLAPTVLSLAGVDIPDYMQGSAFLGPQAGPPRDYVHCFRGRMDERYDMMRCVRDKRYKYIRNYMPHRVYGQYLEYLWRMPTTRSWEAAYKSGKTKGPQNFFWQRKPTEELYDTEADPWEVNNLVEDPEYQETLRRLRAENRRYWRSIHDAGFLPEGMMLDRAGGDTIYQMVRDEARYPLAEIMQAAEMASEQDPQHLPKLVQGLQSDDAAIRYWSAVGCAILGPEAKPAEPALRRALEDPSGDVRLAAAESLLKVGIEKLALEQMVEDLRTSPNPKIRLHAANVLEEAGPLAKPYLPALRKATKDSENYVQRATRWTVEKLEK